MKINSILRAFLVLLTLFTNLSDLAAQKKEEIFLYRFTTPSDSVLVHSERKEYDEQGRMWNTDISDYQNKGGKSVVAGQTFFKYNYQTRLGESAKDGKSYRTIFKLFAGVSTANKVQSEKTFDNSGNLTREDTFTYDKDLRILNHYEYVYTGSTSKKSEHYNYDKKGLLKKQINYYYWTSISMKGKFIEKKDKTLKLKFKYNKSGQLAEKKGIIYTTKINQKIKYDAGGKILEKRTIETYSDKAKSKKDKNKKKTKHKNQYIERYKNGKMTLNLTIMDGVETNRKEMSWLSDSVQTRESSFTKGKKTNEIFWEYRSNLKLLNKKNVQYMGDTQASEDVTEYDENGNLIREKRIVGTTLVTDNKKENSYKDGKYLILKKEFLKDKHYNTTIFQYDNQMRLVKETNSNPEGEKTSVKYIYYTP